MAIRTSSSASLRNRKRGSAEAADPWSRCPQMEPGQRPVQKPSLRRTGEWLRRLGRRPPGVPGDELPPGGGAGPRRGGAVARKRASEPVPVGGCGCMPPSVADVPVIHAIPPIPTGIFFPRWMSLARCAARSTLPCFPASKTAAGRSAAAWRRCCCGRIPAPAAGASQRRRVQPAQSAKSLPSLRPSDPQDRRAEKWRLRCDLLCTAHSSGGC